MAVEGKPCRRQRSSRGAWTIRALHDSQILRRLRADARGASAAEYAILLGLVGAFATFVVFAWRDHDEYVIPAGEVAQVDRANLAERRAAMHLAENPT